VVSCNLVFGLVIIKEKHRNDMMEIKKTYDFSYSSLFITILIKFYFMSAFGKPKRSQLFGLILAGATPKDNNFPLFLQHFQQSASKHTLC
jgi:hypothetical protein